MSFHSIIRDMIGCVEEMEFNNSKNNVIILTNFFKDSDMKGITFEIRKKKTDIFLNIEEDNLDIETFHIANQILSTFCQRDFYKYFDSVMITQSMVDSFDNIDEFNDEPKRGHNDELFLLSELKIAFSDYQKFLEPLDFQIVFQFANTIATFVPVFDIGYFYNFKDPTSSYFMLSYFKRYQIEKQKKKLFYSDETLKLIEFLEENQIKYFLKSTNYFDKKVNFQYKDDDENDEDEKFIKYVSIEPNDEIMISTVFDFVISFNDFTNYVRKKV